MRKSLFIPSTSKILLVDFLLLLVLVFGVLLSPKTQAGSTYSSNSVSCVSNTGSDNGVRPSPYTGGANLARVYYPEDGSTVTVTTTGAVIKQSPCGTPYRQGWVNPANISCLNTYGELSGQMSSGSSNPYSSNTYNPNSTYNCGNTQPAVSYTYSSTTTSTPAPQPAAQTVVYSTAPTTSKNAAIPNTGPGNILALGIVSTILGTIGHLFYKRYRLINT